MAQQAVAGGGQKLLNQFNSVESLIGTARNLAPTKKGPIQGFVNGNIDHIFNGLANSYVAVIQHGKAGAFFVSGKIRVGLHNSTKTGLPTIDINKAGEIFKIRVTQ